MTSTIEIEILVFRVCFGDRTLVRPENKQINVSDSSFLCHLKIVKWSQQNAIGSIIKARWGPCILKISHKILLLSLSFQWRHNVWAVCPTGYFLQGLWRNDGAGWLSQIEVGKCCKPITLPDHYGACYNENIWGSFNHYGVSECKRDGYYVAGLYKSNCNTLGCIEMLKCCSMFIGESYWKSVKHFIISIDEIWWNTLKLSVLAFTSS